MAPDAEKTRNQFHDGGSEVDVHGITIDSLSGDEVAIDGIVYTLNDFNHPGGDQIKLFGGNDVTVQYKMIHPHHTPKQLSKMTIVGKLSKTDYEYQFDTPFERELKQEVFKIVRRGREFGTVGYWSRAVFYIALYFACLYGWIVESSFALAAVFGLAHALIGLNVQHDANHGAASRKPFLNDLLGFGVDLIGNSKWLWMEQHWFHHAFTNHKDKDPDAVSAEPLLILNNYPVGHPNRRWHHKFQVLITLPALALYWVAIVLSTGFLDLQHPGAAAGGFNMDNDFVKNRVKYAVLSRILYVSAVIVPPFYQQGMSLTPFLHIMVMGAVGSLVLSALFIISHNFESVERDPTYDARTKGKKVCWYKSQVETSSSYGGFVSGCLTGGLNFQIEHHLFPRMCSAWYPFIAPTVRAVCEKHGITYTYYPWLLQNLIATTKHIHSAGIGTLDPVKQD